jgi:hypothetical protein
MKNRNTILMAILSALACFTLLPKASAAPAPETPDPASTCALCTADGSNALANSTGSANSAFGWFSLFANADGSLNTGLGAGALLFNVSGTSNTAVGAAALLFSTGANNVALGAAAGLNQDTGTNNVYIGDAGAAGESNVIAIGGIPSSGTPYDSVFIGNDAFETFIGGIFGADVDVGTAVPVLIDAGGKLGTNAVAANGKARVRNPQGAQPQAMLNKSDHRKLQELQATVARQQKEMAMLTTQLKEQAAQIQKVSAQLEVSKPAPRTVANK